jgi:hypothetical protein
MDRPDSQRSEPAADAAAQTVSLAKGRHRWVFSYRAGEERSILSAVSDLAAREGVPFDWFDAALVSHQVARRLRSGLERTDVARRADRAGSNPAGGATRRSNGSQSQGEGADGAVSPITE